jgi:glycosyltransferase involved in cell wall biosynthesis
MATFRRPDLLPGAISALCTQAVSIEPAAMVIVIDNDPEAGARSEVDRWAAHGVRYVHEPSPGIAAARNKALSEAGDADALVFIDDDEVPVGEWLTSLVGCWKAWGCAAVAGPVERDLPQSVDPWIVEMGVFARRRRPNGTVIRGAATSNLLLDVRQLRRQGLRFDPRFGLSGGEDTMLTHSISKRGGRIQWCDSAVVKEIVDPHRLSRRWVRFRLVRAGNAWARVQILLCSTSAGRACVRTALVSRAGYLSVRGMVRLGRGLLTTDLGARCRGERDVLSALGVVLGSMGVAKYEYVRTGRSRPSTPRPVSRRAA